MQRSYFLKTLRAFGITASMATMIALSPSSPTSAAPALTGDPVIYCQPVSATAGDGGDGVGGDANANGGNARAGTTTMAAATATAAGTPPAATAARRPAATASAATAAMSSTTAKVATA